MVRGERKVVWWSIKPPTSTSHPCLRLVPVPIQLQAPWIIRYFILAQFIRDLQLSDLNVCSRIMNWKMLTLSSLKQWAEPLHERCYQTHSNLFHSVVSLSFCVHALLDNI